MGSGTIRLGGLLGIASAGLAVPACVIASPDKPKDSAAASSYFDDASTFLTMNGTLPMASVLVGILFLGVLVSVLRSAAGPTGAVYSALIGGGVYFAMISAGYATEVAIPDAILRFDTLSVTEHAQPFLGLTLWLYHYCQIGAAVLIFATAYVVWRTAVLPKWTATLAVLGIPPLLHLWIGVWGAYGSILWFALVGVVMLAIPPRVQVESVVA